MIFQKKTAQSYHVTLAMQMSLTGILLTSEIYNNKGTE